LIAMPERAQRGMTLVEVSIVVALATLVVMGLLAFYLNSQATWMDGSTQALAQRDGTMLVEEISDRVRHSFQAQVFDSPDSLHQGLVLFDEYGSEVWRFWWEPGSQLVHQGPGLDQDWGPVVASPVTRIQMDTLSRLVDIRLIELRAGDGQLVRTASAAALYNRPDDSP
jgi:prepilin-type N-terminal cleavage/methylation domain-containing protein